MDLARYKILTISSIRCHLAAISFNIKLKSNTDPTKSFAISGLKTYTKLDKPKTIRKPIDRSMLFLLIKSLKKTILLSRNSTSYAMLEYSNACTMLHLEFQKLQFPLLTSTLCYSTV